MAQLKGVMYECGCEDYRKTAGKFCCEHGKPVIGEVILGSGSVTKLPTPPPFDAAATKEANTEVVEKGEFCSEI